MQVPATDVSNPTRQTAAGMQPRHPPAPDEEAGTDGTQPVTEPRIQHGPLGYRSGLLDRRGPSPTNVFVGTVLVGLAAMTVVVTALCIAAVISAVQSLNDFFTPALTALFSFFSTCLLVRAGYRAFTRSHGE